jgi:hypothetical protein
MKKETMATAIGAVYSADLIPTNAPWAKTTSRSSMAQFDEPCHHQHKT